MNRVLFLPMRLILIACLLAFGAGSARGVHAQSLTILHLFGDGSVPNDGTSPVATPILGTDGNFYGTTSGGGVNDAGTVYKMTPSGTVTILYSFGGTNVPTDGASPNGLIEGTDGDFYGTTDTGGYDDEGVVFKVTPSGTETILHSFGGGHDGQYPRVALVQGTDGNFYGTTEAGGVQGGGTAFKITPSGKETVLHRFSDGTVANDGSSPNGLVEGADGDFYGTTANGGLVHTPGGIVYKITPSGKETILHLFRDGSVPNDGYAPGAALVLGTDGDFYGTTLQQPSFPGTAFKITPSGRETVLHVFGDGTVPNDGKYPGAALVQGSDGNFYGTTLDGGSTATSEGFAGYGTVFKMTPSGTVTILHDFQDGSVPNDGMNPAASLVQYRDGSFYGSTEEGGIDMNGTVYRLSPPPAITSLSPTSGPVGAVVTITGTNLGGVTAVRFHDASAKIFSSNSAGTQLTVTVPQGAEKGTITVTVFAESAKTATPFTVTP